MLRKLAGQTAIYGLSSIAARLLNYLLVPLLTRVLTTGEYGVITDMYALIPFAMVLLTLGMETGYFRFAGKAETTEEKRTVFATTWGITSLLALLCMGAVMLFNVQLANVMGYAAHPSYIWLVGAIILLDVATAIPFARLREEGKAGRFVWIRVLSVLINVLLALFLYLVLPHLAEAGVLTVWYDADYGPGYYFVANFIASLVTLFVLFPTYRDTCPRIRWVVLVPILIYSFPLLVSGIAGTANQFIDRQMIKYLMPSSESMEALGVYGAVMKIGVILLLFVQMYRFAAEPFFLSNFKKEDFLRANAEAFKYFVIVSVAIFLGITLFIEPFSLLLGADFREGMFILPIILLANIFSGMTLNLNFWYKQTGDTRFAIWVTGTGLILTLLLNIALIPALGYVGAAWTRLCCEAVMLVLSYYFNRKYYPTPYDLKRVGGYFLMGGLIYLTTLFSTVVPIAPRYMINLALLFLFLSYAVKREKIDLKGLYNAVLRKIKRS